MVVCICVCVDREGHSGCKGGESLLFSFIRSFVFFFFAHQRICRYDLVPGASCSYARRILSWVSKVCILYIYLVFSRYEGMYAQFVRSMARVVGTG